MIHKTSVLEFRFIAEIYLILYETYFPNDIFLVVYRNFHLKLTQNYRRTDGEHFVEIAENLQNFLNLGIKIKSIISDGGKFSIKAVKKVSTKVPFQRCLVHRSRLFRIWLTQNLKHKSGFELHQIAVTIASPVRAGSWVIALILNTKVKYGLLNSCYGKKSTEIILTHWV